MLVPIADGHRSGPTPKSTSAPAPAPATDPASSTLSRLPAELQIAISEYLPYPDALSFKHTSRHFYLLVRTDVKLRVQWLIARMDNHLEGPNMKRCDLRTDRSFWRGNVPALVQRHRAHMECESRPGLGCVVLGSSRCEHRRRTWLSAHITSVLWWVLVALVPIIGYWICGVLLIPKEEPYIHEYF